MVRELGIPQKQLEAIQAFNKNQVEYLLIGGYAMRFYGASRSAMDVDLFTSNSTNNASRLFSAIESLIGHAPGFVLQELDQPRKKVNFHTDGYELEILTSIDGIDFDAAYQKRRLTIEKDVVIPVVSKADLLFIKRLAAQDEKRREKELPDIVFLQSL